VPDAGTQLTILSQLIQLIVLIVGVFVLLSAALIAGLVADDWWKARTFEARRAATRRHSPQPLFPDRRRRMYLVKGGRTASLAIE
jgi:hypothetical protein